MRAMVLVPAVPLSAMYTASAVPTAWERYLGQWAQDPYTIADF